MAILKLTLIPFILLTSCAGKTQFISPSENFNAAMTQTILAAEETREEVLFAAGRAFEQGALSQEKAYLIIEAGDAAQRAINASKTALSQFIALGGSRAPVYASLAILDQIMLDLILKRQVALEGAGEVLQ